MRRPSCVATESSQTWDFASCGRLRARTPCSLRRRRRRRTQFLFEQSTRRGRRGEGTKERRGEEGEGELVCVANVPLWRRRRLCSLLPLQASFPLPSSPFPPPSIPSFLSFPRFSIRFSLSLSLSLAFPPLHRSSSTVAANSLSLSLLSQLGRWWRRRRTLSEAARTRTKPPLCATATAPAACVGFFRGSLVPPRCPSELRRVEWECYGK